MPRSLVCENCGKIVSRPIRGTEHIDRYCSRVCAGAARRHADKPCIVCGILFHNSHKTRECCSTKCRIRNKRLRAYARVESQFNEPIRDLLYRLYHTNRQSIDQIAKLTQTSDRVIWEWLHEFGIPRRDRSSAVKLQWVGNDKRKAAQREKNIQWRSDNPERAQQITSAAQIASLQRKGPTSIEKRMISALDKSEIQYIYQFIVGNKFACDFGFPDAMLIVECDGTYWHSKPEQMKKDASKTAYLRKCGYTVVRFSDKEIEADVMQCVQRIKSLLP